MQFLYRTLAPILSLLALAIGVYLYFHSAALYSAATTHSPNPGYHHFQNYWCELYNDITYTGQPTTSGHWARASTLALVACLFFFWLAVPALFPDYRILARTVRIAGGLSSVAAALVFTDLHDRVITLAAPLGFAAILATCIGLARRREAALFLEAILAVSVSLTDYLAWKLDVWKTTQPLIQKCAIALVFLWALATCLKVLFARSRDAAGAPNAPQPAATGSAMHD